MVPGFNTDNRRAVTIFTILTINGAKRNFKHILFKYYRTYCLNFINFPLFLQAETDNFPRS